MCTTVLNGFQTINRNTQEALTRLTFTVDHPEVLIHKLSPRNTIFTRLQEGTPESTYQI